MVQQYTKQQREWKNEQCKAYYHKQRSPEEEEEIKEKKRKYQRDFRARLKLKFAEDPEYEKQYLEKARQRAIESHLRKKSDVRQNGYDRLWILSSTRPKL